MEIKKDDLIAISNEIANEIKENFKAVHLSGNLSNTLKTFTTEKSAGVEIPAMIYNMKKFRQDRVIVYYYKGSYAERVNQQGGLSKGRVHKGYVEQSVENGIKSWANSKKLKIKIKSEE